MSFVCCNVALSEGKWQTKPTLAAVSNILKFYFGRNLRRVGVLEPELDVMLQIEVAADTGLGCGHEEAVRDRIVSALLRRFQPEYESQVEIEIV